MPVSQSTSYSLSRPNYRSLLWTRCTVDELRWVIVMGECRVMFTVCALYLHKLSTHFQSGEDLQLHAAQLTNQISTCPHVREFVIKGF